MPKPARTKHPLLDGVAGALAALILAALLVTAWHDVSRWNDSWWYHLPFAARLVGLIGPDTFELSSVIERRYQGLPLFAELLQGALWRVTGRVQAANLVAWSSLPVLAWFVRRWFAVPVGYPILGLVAVPLVQLHAVQAYIDLPANVCAAIVWLASYRALLTRSASRRDLVVAIAFGAAATNMKFQLVPFVIVGSLPLAWFAIRQRHWILLGLAVPLFFFTMIKNAILYGNPAWPIALAGFPAAEPRSVQGPSWLHDAAAPVRFACSVLELRLPPIGSPERWTVDQWRMSAPSHLMGGYFSFWAVANLIALVIAAVRGTKGARLALATFAVLTAITAFMPQANELRYYLVWMIVLVTFNVVLWTPTLPGLYLAVAMTAFGVVAWSTRAEALTASGLTLGPYMAHHVSAHELDAIRPGDRICVRRGPHNLLYSRYFHPSKPKYTVIDGFQASDCVKPISPSP